MLCFAFYPWCGGWRAWDLGVGIFLIKFWEISNIVYLNTQSSLNPILRTPFKPFIFIPHVAWTPVCFFQPLPHCELYFCYSLVVYWHFPLVYPNAVLLFSYLEFLLGLSKYFSAKISHLFIHYTHLFFKSLNIGNSCFTAPACYSYLNITSGTPSTS